MQTPRTDRRNSRKGLLMALALHSAIVAALLYPFLTGFTPEPQEFEMLVELDLTQYAAAANAEKTTRTKSVAPVTKRKAAPKSPAKPTPPATKAPPVLTSPEPAPPAVEVPEVADVTEPSKLPVPTKTKTSPKPAPPAPPTSKKDESGTASADGDTDGSPTTGDGEVVGDKGEGLSPIGSALDGEGILARAVVYRPSLDDIIHENGTVVLNICINQQGRVIGVKWNEERSTITDTKLVRKAISKAKKYTFEKDYAAPKRECGALTITIEGL